MSEMQGWEGRGGEGEGCQHRVGRAGGGQERQLGKGKWKSGASVIFIPTEEARGDVSYRGRGSS